MKLTSIVKAINDASKSLASVFTTDSIEYRVLKSIVMTNLPHTLVQESKGIPFRLSYSKASLRGLSNFETELRAIMAHLRGTDNLGQDGKPRPRTALNYAKVHDPTMTLKRLNSFYVNKDNVRIYPERERMRQSATSLAAISDAIEDYYDAKEYIVNSAERLAATQMFKDIRGHSGNDALTMHRKATENVKNILIKQAKQLNGIESPAIMEAYQVTEKDIMGRFYRK